MKTILFKLLILLLIISLNSCIKRKINKNACKDSALFELVGDSCHIWVPNIFTPNNDMVNDVLYVRGAETAQTFEFKVKKNRKIIFETKIPHEGWDGFYNNKYQTGIFNYSISGVSINGENFSFDGEVTCINDWDNSQRLDYSIENCNNCAFGDQYVNGSYNPQLPSMEGICN